MDREASLDLCEVKELFIEPIQEWSSIEAGNIGKA